MGRFCSIDSLATCAITVGVYGPSTAGAAARDAADDADDADDAEGVDDEDNADDAEGVDNVEGADGADGAAKTGDAGDADDDVAAAAAMTRAKREAAIMAVRDRALPAARAALGRGRLRGRDVPDNDCSATKSGGKGCSGLRPPDSSGTDLHLR
jgi:hypothetical protein